MHRSIDKELLTELYTKQGLSMQQIADEFDCSLHKIDYWMKKHDIKKRSRSDAAYQRANPDGDPFTIKKKLSPTERELWGLGIGLYWGEGTKASPTSVRLGNSDPGIVKQFMRFLVELCGVDKDQLRFGMQLFTDCDNNEALDYWTRHLAIKKSQFYKITRTQSGKIGTYRRKNQYGVVTLYFNNKKLRDILVSRINKMPR